ncbi:hypothetical protein FJZ17_00140 [Candidatus Pacearchaeota archaeon]|nr:hypothetical protein [Candidatus Pacearchaeota archaeon]
MLKNKKAAESLAISKIITLILVLLVIVAVVLFFTKPEIFGWIRNLPGFQQSPDNENTLTPTQIKALNYELIGKIELKQESVKDFYIIFLDNVGTSEKPSYKEIPSNLYVELNEGQGEIIINVPGAWNDKTLGTIKNYFFVINSIYYHKYIGSVDVNEIYVRKLEGAKIVGAEIFKSKSKELLPEDPIVTLISQLNTIYFKSKNIADKSLLLVAKEGEEGRILIENSKENSLLYVGNSRKLLAMVMSDGKVYVRKSYLVDSYYTFDSRITFGEELGDTGFYLTNLVYKSGKLEIIKNNS